MRRKWCGEVGNVSLLPNFSLRNWSGLEGRWWRLWRDGLGYKRLGCSLFLRNLILPVLLVGRYSRSLGDEMISSGGIPGTTCRGRWKLWWRSSIDSSLAWGWNQRKAYHNIEMILRERIVIEEGKPLKSLMKQLSDHLKNWKRLRSSFRYRLSVSELE